MMNNNELFPYLSFGSFSCLLSVYSGQPIAWARTQKRATIGCHLLAAKLNDASHMNQRPDLGVG